MGAPRPTVAIGLGHRRPPSTTSMPRDQQLTIYLAVEQVLDCFRRDGISEPTILAVIERVHGSSLELIRAGQQMGAVNGERSPRSFQKRIQTHEGAQRR